MAAFLREISWPNVEFRSCTRNCISIKLRDVITHPCSTLNSYLAKLPFEFTGVRMSNYIPQKLWDIINYPLFADADTGIYPHAASQYHAWPKAKRGIVMLSVDKFPYPWEQTKGNEFIPCSNNICDILKRFRSFKIPAITLIWPKPSYKHSVTRSYCSGKESGRRSESPLWRHQWHSFVFISHAYDVKRRIRPIFHGC